MKEQPLTFNVVLVVPKPDGKTHTIKTVINTAMTGEQALAAALEFVGLKEDQVTDLVVSPLPSSLCFNNMREGEKALISWRNVGIRIPDDLPAPAIGHLIKFFELAGIDDEYFLASFASILRPLLPQEEETNE